MNLAHLHGMPVYRQPDGRESRVVGDLPENHILVLDGFAQLLGDRLPWPTGDRDSLVVPLLMPVAPGLPDSFATPSITLRREVRVVVVDAGPRGRRRYKLTTWAPRAEAEFAHKLVDEIVYALADRNTRSLRLPLGCAQ